MKFLSDTKVSGGEENKREPGEGKRGEKNSTSDKNAEQTE